MTQDSPQDSLHEYSEFFHSTDNTEYWVTRAKECAKASIRWVCRKDRYGFYLPAGSLTSVEEKDGELTLKGLEEHYKGIQIKGIHTGEPINQKSFFCAGDFDFKPKEMESMSPQEIQVKRQNILFDVLKISDRLDELHIHHLIEDSNGVGAIHLWIPFWEGIHLSDSYEFIKYLIEYAGRPDYNYEAFPKQAELTLTGKGSCGNWIRLPSKHHSRNHWSRFYNKAAGAWLDSKTTVQWWLNILDNPAEVIENFIATLPPPVPESPPLPINRSKEATYTKSNTKGTLNVGRYLTRTGANFITEPDCFKFPECPWKHEHTTDSDHSMVIFANENKSIGVHCFHNHCQNRKWKDVWNLFGKPIPSDFDNPKSIILGAPEDDPLGINEDLEEERNYPTDVYPDHMQDLFKAKSALCKNGNVAYMAHNSMAVFAGLIGSSADLYVFSGYIEHSILWCGKFAPTGSKKTAFFNEYVNPAKIIENDLVEENKKEMGKYMQALEEYKENKKQGFAPQIPIPKSFYETRFTLEYIFKALNENPKGLLVARDELIGWITEMDAHRNKPNQDITSWLDFFGGDLTTRGTIKHGKVSVARPRISICGGIQPQLFQEAFNFRASVSGLTSRILFIDPPEKNEIEYEKPKPEVYKSLQQEYLALANKLYYMPFRLLKYEKGAFEAIEEWNDMMDKKGRMVRIQNELTTFCTDEELTVLSGYYSKFSIFSHRFSLILALIHNPSATVVTEEIALKAIRLADFLAKEQLRIRMNLLRMKGFKEGREVATTDKFKEMILKKKANGVKEIPLRDIYKPLHISKSEGIDLCKLSKLGKLQPSSNRKDQMIFNINCP